MYSKRRTRSGERVLPVIRMGVTLGGPKPGAAPSLAEAVEMPRGRAEAPRLHQPGPSVSQRPPWLCAPEPPSLQPPGLDYVGVGEPAAPWHTSTWGGWTCAPLASPAGTPQLSVTCARRPRVDARFARQPQYRPVNALHLPISC